ncbi:MAG TPA: hypothetical protein VK427_27130 [Kofleriaceae bacterium]|nr:hypothetical protein [Kofleriaceae bacterium]
MWENCYVCGQPLLSAEDAQDIGMCSQCRRTLGIVPLPPPRRRPHPCARCNGMRFVRIVPREYALQPGIGVALQPVAATREIRVKIHADGHRELMAIEQARPLGVLETYICTGCGFVEWYCQDPAAIPIGPTHMSDIVDYGSDTPYR